MLPGESLPSLKQPARLRLIQPLFRREPGTVFHLHKHQGLPIERHKIEFERPHSHAPSYERVAQVEQVPRGPIFGVCA